MMKSLGAVLLVLMVAACVGPMGSIRDAKDDQSALVYGYINGSRGVPNVTLYNDSVKVMAPWMPGNTPAHRFNNGLVVFANVEPGEYTIHGFGIGQTAYDLGTERIRLTVRPGEVKYLGAFQYAKNGGLLSNKFSFAPTKDPSHSTVLQWAIDATADTDWSEKLRARQGKS